MSDAAEPARVRALDAWAGQLRLRVEWLPARAITYTAAVGAWEVDLAAVTGAGDALYVHQRSPTSFWVELLSGAGHVEVRDVDAVGLSSELEGAVAFFRSWRAFMSEGPGRGH